MENNDERLIEKIFPIMKVGEEATREKSIRHGHISTLHIWWARRPLASSRTTNYAALVPAPKSKEEMEHKKKFIQEFAEWENSLSNEHVNKARNDILKAYGNHPPRILDPFAGGAAIPLEALRIGCEIYSSDLNPVAVLLQKCTLEYPQRYGRIQTQDDLDEELVSSYNQLLEDVDEWANTIFSEAQKLLRRFFANQVEDEKILGCLWAWTLPCQNPSCSVEIPLLRQYWLARRKRKGEWRKRVALHPVVSTDQVDFEIVGTEHKPFPKGYDPSKATVSRAVVTCPRCGNTIDANTTRNLFGRGEAEERLVAVITRKPGKLGNSYRIPTSNDLEQFALSVKELEQREQELLNKWGINPIPDEPLPPKGTLGFRVQRYGMLKWGDLFNPRQKLVLLTFTHLVKSAYEKMIEEGYEEEYAKALTTYLALMVDRLADKDARLVFYNVYGEKIEHVFGRQALPMVWDYVELNPFASVGWPNMKDWILRAL